MYLQKRGDLVQLTTSLGYLVSVSVKHNSISLLGYH
jgi:hypothetical protein